MNELWASAPGQDGEESVYRKDSTYETYMNGYVVDVELMALYRKYMK